MKAKSPEPSMPVRWLLIGWLLLVLAGIALLDQAPTTVDLKLLEAEFAVLRRVLPTAVADSPVLIAADEATLAAFPEPIALWHRYLGAIFGGLARAGPRAVGVDIELPQRSQDALSAGIDLALARGLLALKAAAPLVIARNVDDGGAVKPVYAPYLAIVGPSGSGLSTWPVDADGSVRRFDERQGADGSTVPTLTGVIARRLGSEPAPGLIDFARGEPFAYLPMHEVWRWIEAGDAERLRRAVAGRVVLVGAVFPFVDRHRQPVNLAGWDGEAGAAPGLLLHAQALRSMLGHGLIRSASLAWGLPALLAASLLWFVFARPIVGLATLVCAGIGLFGLALWLLHRGIHLPVAAPMLIGLCAGAGRTGYDAWFHRRERVRLKRAFEGYVSPNVLDLIVAGRLDSQMGTGRRSLCVLFADIRDFTPLSERTAPERVVELLNRYFECMTAAIHRHDGTVDNFRGDGIMCIFGAPLATASPCRDGFLAATEMLAALAGLNADLARDGFEPIAVGVSLAYGEAVVGHIGAAARHEYTAIGDVANVSARLEAMTKEVGYPLVVSGAVADALAGIAVFDDLGERALKGHAPVRACGWPARLTAEVAKAAQ